MMKKYRKKPVVIDAIQLTPQNVKKVYELVHGEPVVVFTGVAGAMWEQYVQSVVDGGMNIPTLEDGKDGRAKHVASIGDWIIRGVKGEFYPVKPHIFPELYEKHED